MLDALPDVLEAFCLPTTEGKDDDFCPKLSAMLEGQRMNWDELPPECDEGCVEYKWRLGPEHTHRRLERLATQMKFRLNEGNGTAYYLLGVRDSGIAEGLTAREHSEAVSVLMAAAGAADSILLFGGPGLFTETRPEAVLRVALGTEALGGQQVVQADAPLWVFGGFPAAEMSNGKRSL
eukprot:Skav220501  [mRNA]  locus=scaffold4697:39089:54676:- [translate_table: standard]